MPEEDIEEQCRRKRLRRGAGGRFRGVMPEEEIEELEKEMEECCRRKRLRRGTRGRDCGEVPEGEIEEK